MSIDPLPEMTPEQRFQEIAALLKKGFERCKPSLRPEATPPKQISSESATDGLEIPAETRLSGSRCIGG